MTPTENRGKTALIFGLGSLLIAGGLGAQETRLTPETEGLARIINRIGVLESNRDPKCYATASRLEDFMYGTPLTEEARLRKAELQKALIREIWGRVSRKAEAVGLSEADSLRIQRELNELMKFPALPNGDLNVEMPVADPVCLTKRDLDHYGSVAYGLRAILSVQQENILSGDDAFLPLTDDAIDVLKKFLDRYTLAALNLADRTARQETIREISAERFEAAWKTLSPETAAIGAGASVPEDLREGEARFAVINSIVRQKVESFAAYNEISNSVFLRNLQVYYARHPWPKDPEKADAFRSAFTESVVSFARDILREASSHAEKAGHPLIRLNDAEAAVQNFASFQVNQFEDVIFFPKLPRENQVVLESYDCDSFRDSGLHWRYLEFALQDELKQNAALLEPDPFAAEMLVEGIAQFGVLVLRVAGSVAEEEKAPTLAVSHLKTAFDRIQSYTNGNGEAPDRNDADAGKIASSESSRSAKPGGGPFFAEITEQSGIRFEHRSADWLSRQLRSYLKTGQETGTLTIPPAFGGSGVAAEDVDGDGDIDLLLLGGLGNRLYLNQGDETFRDGTVEAGLDWKRSDGTYGEPRQPMIADFDNDGDQDIVITFVDDDHRVYRNSGGGKFEDITETAGLGGKGLVGGPATVCDFDNDGLLDIYIGYFGDYLNGALPNLSRHNTNALRNKLFRNAGDLVFEDITEGSGVDNPGWTQAVGHSDFDRDGWQDLIVGNDFGVNSYYRNKGDGSFEDLGGKLGTDKASFTMNVGIADLNRDLFPDFYISNIVTMVKDDKYVLPNKDTKMQFDAETLARMRVVEANDLFVSSAQDGQLDRYELSQNVGRGFESTGWSWDADFFDFDNDGDDDLYCVNGMNEYAVYSDTPYYSDTTEGKQEIVLPVADSETNIFFLNEGGKLENRSETSGLDFTANSRSAAYLDFDSDGDLDVVVNNYHGSTGFFRNDAAPVSNRWLKVRLTGDPAKGSNRDAIGSKLVVTLPDGKTLWREVHGTIGYLSVHPKEQHFGLGQAEKVSLEITWPNGEVETRNLEVRNAGRRYEIVQGKGVTR